MMNFSFDDPPPANEVEEDEMPPFALTDSHLSQSPTSLTSSLDTPSRIRQSFVVETTLPLKEEEAGGSSMSNKTAKTLATSIHDSQNSATPPGLVESMMTDGSSSMQSGSDTGNSEIRLTSPQHVRQTRPPTAPTRPTIHPMAASSTYLMSSLHTVHSDAGTSTFLSPSQLPLHSSRSMHHSTSPSSAASDVTPRQSNILLHQSDSTSSSIGFSQLLQDADDSDDVPPGLSTPMAPLPEDEEEVLEQLDQAPAAIACSQVSGALIVEPIPESPASFGRSPPSHRWALPSLPTWGGGGGMQHTNDRSLQTPLLMAASSTPVTRLLSNNSGSDHHANTPLERAKDTVQAMVEDDQTFQVSMRFHDDSVRVEDVMRILANPELLRLWCDPIETLIVTSSSTEGSDGDDPTITTTANQINERTPERNDREYEGEWIEATTTALGSPPSSVGFLYSAGHTLLETLGFASYGRITMFVERRRGHVGLTVGPFHGGINASHTITVTTGSDGRVSIVDRVRLTRNEEEVSLTSFFGCFDSCLSRCVLPSITGYLNQVTTSLARLRLLVENTDISSGVTSIMVVNAPRW